MRGGRVGFIENRARLAQHHHARRMTVLRELWYCHVAVLSFHASSPSNPPRFPCAYPFLSDFRGQFWRSSGTQNGSCGISSESSRRPLSNDIKFARIGVRTRELWLPEVGVSELFFVHSSDEDSGQTGDAIGEPRVPRRSRSHYLSNAPGLADQLVASRKDSAREGGSCAAYFCKVPDSRESELGLVRYGPASRVHRGVFGPFEGSFPIRIPADPDKFLAIREFHVVHGCVLFPMCPGSQINLLRVRKTLCASVATSVGKFRNFQQKPYFRRPVFTRVALHRGELGFARYDLANGGRRNVPYAKGGGQFDPVFGLVNGPVKPWSNLVNLGQTWSNLVKALQTLGNYLMRDEPSSEQTGLGSGCLVLRADTRENPGVDRGLLEALASFWDPTHCCFSIGEVDLIPTMEEYAELLQLDSPFQRDLRFIPIQGPRSNRCLEKYLGLTTAVLRPEIARPEETWRKANISLDLLTKYFSRSAFPAKLARDFIVGKKGWKKFRINAFKIAFAGIFLFPTSCWRQGEGVPMFCTQLLQLWFCSHLRHFYRLQTPYHFERHTVSQTVHIALPFTGNSRDWASYLLRPCPWVEWVLEGSPWGPAVVDALDSLCPLRWSASSWGVGLYRLLSQPCSSICGGSSPGLRLSGEGRLSEMVLIEEGSPGDSSVTSDFVEWREGWTPFFTSQAYSTARCTIFFDISLLFGYQPPLGSLREKASAARVESLRSTLHHNSVAVANVRRDLVAQRGNVSTLRTMNEFIREQLEISEDAKEQLEETLAEAREQLETEQAERTRVQDELDSLRSYTQALVDPATGRPQDIVASPTGARCDPSWIWCMMLLSPMLLGSIRRVSLWSLLFHQINQVMDSLGTRARAVWEEHDEGDPALSTALGRFCRETCIRLGH
uniref:DUF7745 domain-containing protein n=1 Tax=Fagus sylvatica TaxID=28930 RepID=A0A2N9GRI8_FAGSY